MKRLLLARTVLGAIGVAVWGYGVRNDLERTRLAAIGILAIAFLLRFLPARWFETAEERHARELAERRDDERRGG
jgi:hypothetical protein